MNHEKVEIPQGSLRSYFIGLIVSLALALIAYFAVAFKVTQGITLHLLLGLLGLIQAWSFLYYFLDLGNEEKPRWNLGVFLFMVLVTVILVVGSLWIMYHLNYNLMMME